MLYNYFTEKLLNLQGVLIKNIEKIDGTTYVYLEIPAKEHTCPNCGPKTKYVHNYRSRKIKDLPAFDQNIILIFLN
ncbi:MAG: transposase [Oscillospiraceae bacterium]|nr:transposase [Oscillospiraceae bacterium]